MSESINDKPGRSPSSEVNVLPGESQAEYDELWESWQTDYPAADERGAFLLKQACEAHWLLRRFRGRYNEAEARVFLEQEDAMEWTEEQHRQIARFRQYLTAAERQFARAFSMLEKRRAGRFRETIALQRTEARRERLRLQEERRATAACKKVQREAAKQSKAEATEVAKNEKPTGQQEKTFAGQLFQGQNSAKKKKKVYVLEQWVEVRIEGGQTVTRLYPSNKNLIERGKAMWPPPDLVYRRFNFPDGVPEEYRWVGLTDERARFGGMGVQRMTPDRWFEVTGRESQEVPREGYQSSTVPGHLGPTGEGNLPRPQERGGCECRICTQNQAVLDRRQA